MSQMSFGDAEYAGKRKRTRREVFLAEMDQVVPWARLLALIEPAYPKSGNGRPPYPLATMLRVHLMQTGTPTILPRRIPSSQPTRPQRLPRVVWPGPWLRMRGGAGTDEEPPVILTSGFGAPQCSATPPTRLIVPAVPAWCQCP